MISKCSVCSDSRETPSIEYGYCSLCGGILEFPNIESGELDESAFEEKEVGENGKKKKAS